MLREKKRRPKVEASTKRQRLTPEIRRTQIMEAATQLIVQQGYLPLQIEKLAKIAGSSKALIYTYFPEQDALFNAILERELNGLLAAGLETASQVQHLDQAASLCAQLYFEHVARYGPLLNILLSDRYMRSRVNRNLLLLRNGVLRRLGRLAQKELPLSKRETLAALEMVTGIPEEAGRLVFHRELEASVARQICRTLVASCLRALRDPDRVLRRAHDVSRTLNDHRKA